jgi:3-keto-5-aminohexanoate cleavage enzyme
MSTPQEQGTVAQSNGQRGARRPVAIGVAPNGGRRTKADHPALPLTPEELARTSVECAEAGAAMIHVHVRNSEGRHLLDGEAYRAVIDEVSKTCGMRLLVQITTESLGKYDPMQQVAIVQDVRPESASLALRELAPTTSQELLFADLLRFMRNENIIPQIIVYTPAELQRLVAMQKRGVIPFASLPVLYALGRYAPGMTSSAEDLLPFLELPRDNPWMVCAFGAAEAQCGVAGALLGGDIRVGFENNLHTPHGTLASGNADLVASVATPLRNLGFKTASADDLREHWSRQ